MLICILQTDISALKSDVWFYSVFPHKRTIYYSETNISQFSVTFDIQALSHSEKKRLYNYEFWDRGLIFLGTVESTDQSDVNT